ncbi:extracellular solute-binding protein [Cohnella thailandensis]|uniref:Extracellular solute-binding protein n=1 Tax=Cohnella thailandensis TaxID=557557 RepID=A0A841T2V0_9BACL|nr:extracellular solute-binding protein [Cohnella thailandensis]MBB6637186.1 extracellular solute-binding protein [Cohnella thailandensis]MBP1976993.1 putative aldouronate transport system substrate-binding protein [Cohnella thailandensis]
MNQKLHSKAVLALLASIIIVSGCSNSDNNDNAGNSGNTGTATENASPEASGSVDAENASPLGKYETPISLTVGRDVGANDKFPEGDSVASNVWTRIYKEELGIDVKVAWSALTGEQYDQKMKLNIASGDLPDLMAVTTQQLAQLVENDQIADLTDVFNKYSSELNKKVYQDDGGIALKSATFNGKLMALPQQGSALDTSNVLWIRQDWLDKLGLQPPQTMEDVKKIAEAFTKQDPDGNGKADTFGLGITKTMWNGSPSLEGFFNGYHSYPTIWVKDATGNLGYGAVQPQSKQALADLQAMYQAGWIDVEFGVKDANQVNQDINANKIGMYYGKMYSPFTFMDTASKNPDIQWQSYPLPSVDSTPASTQQDFPVQYYYVVKKGYANPEALIKIFNLQLEVSYGSNADLIKRIQDQLYSHADDQQITSTQVVSAPIVKGGLPTQNLNQYLNINKAIADKDESVLSNEVEKTNYKYVLDYEQTKNPSSYGTWAVVGPKGPFKVLNDYLNNKQFVLTEFVGAATPTMVTKKSTLDKLVLEEFTKIITGAKSADEFDKFVQNWNKLGGEQITKEVNEANASR